MEDGTGQCPSKQEDISPLAQHESTLEHGVDNYRDERSPRSASLTRFTWVVLCSSLLLAMMQAALDITMTTNLQPTIIKTFGEIAKFPWIIVTYSLGMGSTCLVW